ncbi:MAG TPA: ABC transporter ATP-binding protein [Chloroflexota bacterium]|nr:ABC transporter ATP-binding protein [Chloroflexota bacterium]
MLSVREIHTYYGLAHILQGVSLEVKEREIVALLGRNGAGKSTTLKSIIGLTPPRSGTVEFAGQGLIGMPTHRIARLGIGYVPEERRIFPELSVLENLKVALLAHKLDDPAAALDGMFTMFPRLRERVGQAGRSLSGGEQQMLALARALISNPRLLLIDEPTQGLAPNLVTSIASSLVRIKEQGLAVLLVEQNTRIALEVADRVYVIDQGVIQFEGTADELRANDAMQRQFLTV